MSGVGRGEIIGVDTVEDLDEESCCVPGECGGEWRVTDERCWGKVERYFDEVNRI